ncbi:MAG: UvrB/UvrC motif-containing protein [Candidatus Wildermuthbacteria bacterium]|nr:UvrB/UvrC motif-containing protein [Candidatus Wildermuthbacteria bacterium]
MLLANLGPRLQKNEYLLTAMDGETFGHHRPGLEKLLFDIYQSKELPTATISELLGKHSFEKTACDPIPASWALMHKDIARNLPFSRWYNPKNAIHRMQWQLTALAIGEAKKAKEKGKPYQKARALLDKALHSDQYWWASAKPWWSLEILEKGAKELLEVVLILEGKNIQSAKKAQELYKNIVFTALDWQRNGIVEDLVKEHYDEEVSMRLDTSAPYVPPEEFDKIIEHLRKQMLECAQSEEYEKAAQFRDRITELKGKRKEATSKV